MSRLFNGQVTARLSTGLTADGALLTGPGVLHGLVVLTDGSNAVTVNLYDNTTNAAGTRVLPTGMVFAANPQLQAFGFSPPLDITTGVYLDLTCAGTVTIYGMIDQ